MILPPLVLPTLAYWNTFGLSERGFIIPGPSGRQHGAVRLPAVRQEGEEQPADHVRVRQGLQALRRAARCRLYKTFFSVIHATFVVYRGVHGFTKETFQGPML